MPRAQGRVETVFDRTFPREGELVLSRPIETGEAHALVLFGSSSLGATFRVISFFTLEAGETRPDSSPGIPPGPNVLVAAVEISAVMLHLPLSQIVLPSPHPLPVLGPFFQCTAVRTFGNPDATLTLKVLLLDRSGRDARDE